MSVLPVKKYNKITIIVTKKTEGVLFKVVQKTHQQS